MRRKLRTKPLSNTVIVLPAWLFAMTGIFWICSHKGLDARLQGHMALALLSLPFFGTAAAQVRSGYLCQNLAPGNRGLYRSKAPRRFLISTIGHIVTGTIIIAFAWWRHFHRL